MISMTSISHPSTSQSPSTTLIICPLPVNWLSFTIALFSASNIMIQDWFQRMRIYSLRDGKLRTQEPVNTSATQLKRLIQPHSTLFSWKELKEITLNNSILSTQLTASTISGLIKCSTQRHQQIAQSLFISQECMPVQLEWSWKVS